MTEQKTAASPAGVEFIKGHATENDFLILVDPPCEVPLTSARIATLCDRHRGMGADGFVRLTHTASIAGTDALRAAAPEAQWFMDYYNADGSVAQMCGNAIRLCAQVLLAEGLVDVDDGGSLTIGTRGGARTLTRCADMWTVDMGPARLIRPADAAGEVDGEGWDTLVTVPGLDGPRAGLSIAMPNPHTVIAVTDEAELEAAQWAGLSDSNTLGYDPCPPEGTNVELVAVLGEVSDSVSSADDAEPVRVGRARMRVLERGVGETRSCGTGCCAVAVALHEWEGEDAHEDYLIDVPGGQLGIHVGADPWAEGATILLTGPATITGRVCLSQDGSDDGPFPAAVGGADRQPTEPGEPHCVADAPASHGAVDVVAEIVE